MKIMLEGWEGERKFGMQMKRKQKDILVLCESGFSESDVRTLSKSFGIKSLIAIKSELNPITRFSAHFIF